MSETVTSKAELKAAIEKKWQEHGKEDPSKFKLKEFEDATAGALTFGTLRAIGLSDEEIIKMSLLGGVLNIDIVGEQYGFIYLDKRYLDNV